MRRALVALAMCAACERPAGPQPAPGQPAPTPTPAPTPAPAPTPLATRELVTSLDALTGGSLSSDEADGWARDLDGGQRTIEQLVDRLLASPELGREIIPSLVFGAFVSVRNYYALPTGFNLMKAEPDVHGLVVYYIRKPCPAKEAQTVHPWWALHTEVLVCPDAYRPDKWTVDAGESAYHSSQILECDSQVGSPENEAGPVCGCGPNLIRCMRDTSQYLEFLGSLQDEVKDTTAYVVAHDLPMETLFTGTHTVHDRNVELYYRRQAIGGQRLTDVTKALADLDGWQDNTWAARTELAPGQHAGLLTGPQLLHWLPDRRQRQRGIFEMMWCNGRSNFGATTRQVLDLNKDSANLAFVHSSWQRLAKTPMCTNCHARLDYGFQFFMGYPDSRASTFFVPNLALPGKGPMYGNDIDDPRGEADLTPEGFAELATKQPEFTACMSRHVSDYVLGANPLPADRDAVSDEIKAHHNFRLAFRTALLRYAEARRRPLAGPAASSDEGPPLPPPADPAMVAIGAPLRAALDEHCVDCHDQTKFADIGIAVDQRFDFRGAELPRSLVVRMADQLAYRKMPKNPDALSDPDRRALVELLVAALWRDPRARSEALGYYLGQGRGLQAQQIDNAYRLIHQAAGDEGDSGEQGLLERAIYIDQASFTPDYAANTGLEALRACKAKSLKGTDLDACMDRALSPQRLVRPNTH